MTTGKVYLVGAGPGDPGLISLRAIECLQRADVVLYDGLVNPLVLQHAKAKCERTCRTSAPDGRVLKQDEINERLVAAAKAGNTVVRLKGGDPFIFGRGSEEAAYLRQHGIEYEIIPGITAAVAAGEYAGLSLTHRQHASMVTFVTGHEAPGKPGSALDYAQLAQLPGTLVFYMGLHRLPEIAASLIENGKSATTSAAVISRATTPLQRTVTAELGDLADAVSEAQLVAPSLIIVGSCVQQREELAWFEERPLFGQRIGITRPEAQAAPQISRAIELGAQPVPMPLIKIRRTADPSPLDAALQRLDEFDWLIFTSVNGVDAFFSRLWETGRDGRALGRIRCAAIGPSTAETLAAFHIHADVVPKEYRAEGLATALKPLVAGKRVLWPRANRGRDVLPAELTSAGATVEQVVVYENVDADTLPDNVLAAIEAEELDWIALSSPSIARSFAQRIPDEFRAKLGTTTRLVTISPVTTEAARDAGLPVAAEATTYTWDGIFEAIQQFVGTA
ncbi:MAG: uroporphyrinogen-III C-methyltransferase [Planctomycetota bacterium]|jgi:uroporphyrinogen III methyltransferase/synthase